MQRQVRRSWAQLSDKLMSLGCAFSDAWSRANVRHRIDHNGISLLDEVSYSEYYWGEPSSSVGRRCGEQVQRKRKAREEWSIRYHDDSGEKKTGVWWVGVTLPIYSCQSCIMRAITYVDSNVCICSGPSWNVLLDLGKIHIAVTIPTCYSRNIPV